MSWRLCGREDPDCWKWWGSHSTGWGEYEEKSGDDGSKSWEEGGEESSLPGSREWGKDHWVWGVQAGFGSQPCWMRNINWCQTGRQMLNISLDLSKSVSSPEKWGCLLHRSVRIKSRQWTYCGEIIKRLLIDYVHPHLPLQFSLLCPSLGSAPWGKNVADQKEKEKKTKTKKHLPISAFGQWKGLEWDGKYGVILNCREADEC